MALSLLKHLAFRSPAAKQLLTRDGALGMLRALWPAAASGGGGPLLHEALGCLTNLLPDCPDARARYAGEGDPGASAPGAAPLLGSLLALLFTVRARLPACTPPTRV